MTLATIWVIDISEACGDGMCTLAVDQRWCTVLPLSECRGYTAADLSQAALILQSCGDRFRVAQGRQYLLPFSERDQRLVEVTTQIDGLLEHRTFWREVDQRLQRLCKAPRGFPVGGPGERFRPRLSAVGESLVPHFAPHGVVRQASDLLTYLAPSKRFQGRDDAGMQRPPPLLEETAVGHLVGQGMRKGVFVCRKEPRLVEKLRRLEVREAAGYGVFGHLGNGL